MMQKGASFGAVWEDIKISLRFAIRNVVKFFLAMIGVAIVTVLLLGLVFGLLFIGLFIFAGGIQGFIGFFDTLGTSLESFNLGAMGFGMLILLPLLSPLFVAIGALFGMGREIVESEGASVEGVFTWYRRKFFSLAGGGIILFAIVAFPPIFAFALTSEIMGLVVTPIVSTILGVFTFVWVFITTGFLSMLFPAIIDGYGAIDATILSCRMGWRYFDRVFSVWLSMLGLIFLVFVPIVGVPAAFMYTNSPSALDPGGILLAAYVVPAIIIVALVFIPAAAIALSRVYLILTATNGDSQEDEEETPGLSFVGGI